MEVIDPKVNNLSLYYFTTILNLKDLNSIFLSTALQYKTKDKTCINFLYLFQPILKSNNDI